MNVSEFKKDLQDAAHKSAIAMIVAIDSEVRPDRVEIDRICDELLADPKQVKDLLQLLLRLHIKTDESAFPEEYGDHFLTCAKVIAYQFSLRAMEKAVEKV